MYETFCKMPKPMELSGRWANPKWGDNAKYVRVTIMDVVSCRTNALLEYQWGLPTFSPLDDWEAFHDEDGAPARPLDDYAFLYVNVPDVDLGEQQTADQYFPYTGARSYCVGAVDYMLRGGIITTDNVVYGVRASRLLEPVKLAEAFETIQKAAETGLKDEWSDQPEDREMLLKDFVKLLRLSWIGFCQLTERLEWHEVRSMFVEDNPGNVTRREYLGHGVWAFKACTNVVDLYTMRPYGDIALQMEQCFVHRAMEIMKSIPQAITWGIHVDGLVIDDSSFDLKILEDLLEKPQNRYPSGKPMFQLKPEGGNSLPVWKRRYEERSFDLDLGGLEWRVVEEADAGNQDPQDFLVDQIIANKGGMMNCLGGTGKTVVINRLKTKLEQMAKEEGTNLRLVLMTPRHAAKAQLQDGQTIAHVKHKYAKAQNVFYIVDEAGELGAGALAELARHKLVGSNFLLCGDWDGQLLPMFDRWGDVYNQRGVLESSLMHSLANGLSLKLTKCRRTLKDQAHFYLVERLYKRKYFKPGEPVDEQAFKEELEATLQEYMLIFPVKSNSDGLCCGIPDKVATMSHENRLYMNALINLKLSEKKEVKTWLPWTEGNLAGTTMQPQSCYIWPGMEVCGCTRGHKAGQLTNGIIYVIKDYTDEEVTLSMHPVYNKSHLEHVKYLQSTLDELQPKMHNLVSFLREKDRTLEEFKAAVGAEDDLDEQEIMNLGFSITKKGRGKNAKEYVTADPHYEAWAANPNGPATLPPRIVDPTIGLSWKEFQLQARLTHALPYVYYQGKTVADQTLWLMNVGSRYFTMRHLIMGLGRVQESRRVKILDPRREKALILPVARLAFEANHDKAVKSKKEEQEIKALLEAAEDAVNAEMEGSDLGDFNDASSEYDEVGMVADPFADVSFDD